MTDLSTFVDEIKPKLPQCPKVIITSKLREVLIDFCERTRIVEVDATAIDLTADDYLYDIAFTGDYLPIEIKDAYIGDGSTDDDPIAVTTLRDLRLSVENWKKQTTSSSISKVFLTQGGQARVYPIPTDPDEDLYLSCAVKPTRAATAVEDFLYNDWLEALRIGTLSLLRDIINLPWYDPDRAKKDWVTYCRHRAEATAKSLQGKAAATAIASYNGSSMF